MKSAVAQLSRLKTRTFSPFRLPWTWKHIYHQNKSVANLRTTSNDLNNEEKASRNDWMYLHKFLMWCQTSKRKRAVKMSHSARNRKYLWEKNKPESYNVPKLISVYHCSHIVYEAHSRFIPRFMANLASLLWGVQFHLSRIPTWDIFVL